MRTWLRERRRKFRACEWRCPPCPASAGSLHSPLAGAASSTICSAITPSARSLVSQRDTADRQARNRRTSHFLRALRLPPGTFVCPKFVNCRGSLHSPGSSVQSLQPLVLAEGSFFAGLIRRPAGRDESFDRSQLYLFGIRFRAACLRRDPDCPGCKRTMRLVGREPHSKKSTAEVLTFQCECGQVATVTANQ